ncbi:translocation/assembly module TamB [Pseudomonas kunmingensis]|uniref:translocation/assembly module TamB domain-containing protein n=1 Tax=Stutzerimonas kunmingensis TaxID=1211807 RepID=UPI0015E34402|nr:translocation/assembly module TamB domain-containing protein [Stutzerimonas kunmingensis]MBA1238642.1 translocation/assembly module TamB [Stutzerimonas kunmingensis]
MRLLRGVGWTLLALVLLLAIAVGVLLGTASGSRWLLAQVPGLTVEAFDGRLGQRWQADRLLWEQGGNRVEVQQPRLAWAPGCLLKRTLCIDELTAGDIVLNFPPTEPAPDAEPFTLPDLDLPVALQVERIDIGRVTLNGSEQLRRLHLQANWRADGLDIQQLEVRRDDLDLSLNGRLLPSGAWPLKLEGQAALQSPNEQPWGLMIAVDGDLREQLQVQVESQGYLDGTLSGQLRALDEHLPATIKLNAHDFKALPDLPETLRLNDLQLTATGNMDDGYRVLGTTLLPGEGGVVRVALEGVVGLSGAQIAMLELDAGQQRDVRLSGDVDWQDGLEANADLLWRDFPWRRLYPDIDEPPVALRELKAQIQYDDGNYLGNFQSAMTGPAGDFTLNSPVSGNLESVHLPQLELRAGQGSAVGSVSIGFAEGLDWKADLALSDLDPAYWLAELPGNLGGSLQSQGALRDERLQAEASLDISGRLRGQNTSLQLQASGEGERWTLPIVDLRMGDNRVHGSGIWAQTLEGQLQLELSRLAQLWPDLRGQLNGEVALSGTAAAPSAQVELSGRNLAYQDNRLRRLSLQGQLSDGERGRLALNAERIRAGDTDLGALHVNAEGTAEKHQADLQLQGPLLDLALAFDGGLRGEDWVGRLTRGELSAEQQNWALQRPATLQRFADGRLDLGAHCWLSGPATLCAEDQRLMPDPRIRYRLRDFALQSLAEYLPEDFRWQGELNADIELDLPASGPNGRIQVDAGPGVLRIRDADEWHDFPYQTLVLNSRLLPERIDNELRFQGGELGELEVQLQIDPRPEAKPINGEFRLSGFDLAVARPFVPMVERLRGQLNGSGQLAGSLQQPTLNGQLLLTGGEIAGSELPTAFEDLRVRLLIEGERLNIDGDWRAGEQGRGSLSGALDWQDELDLDLAIKGSRLPVVVEPYADLEVEPDLRIVLSGQELAVSGRIEVPRGAITVRELPPATVRISEDTVIVGREAEEPATPLAVKMDIDVEVGQDRLRFSGFGLTADLAGYLHIGDNLDARGELQLKNGRYRAYGQRLTIRRAELLFTGMISQPFLNIEAIRRIDAENVVAGLRITGSAEQPRIDVFSEPAMSQEQALAYLVLGRALGADTGDSNLLAQAALGLGLAGSSSITGGLAQRLGIQDFQLDTEGTGAGTSVVATGRLTERLALRYGVGVFEPSNTIALRYQLTRRIFLEAASGLASSLDVFYRRDF